MGSLFSGPSKPDTSHIEAQEKRVAEQEAKLASEEAARERKEKATAAARRGRSGKKSLLSGLETGVAADDEEKRGSLG